MEKRDKRVVGAAVAAAIIAMIAILFAGWYFAIRDDRDSQAVGPTPAVPARATADSDSGQTTQSPTAGTSVPRSPNVQPPSPQAATAAANAPAPADAAGATPSPGESAIAGRLDTPPGADQPAVAGQPGQPGQPGQADRSVGSSVSQPAAGSTTGHLPGSPGTTAAAPPAQTAVTAPGRPVTPSGAAVAGPDGSRPAAGSATGNLLPPPGTAGAPPAQATATSPTSSTVAATQSGNLAAGQTQTSSAVDSAPGNTLTSPGTAAAPPAQTASSAPATAGDGGRQTDSVATTPPAGRTVLSDELVAALPSIRPPRFDVVRVNELGDAVIAGRAEPRSIVIIYDGDREIGRVAADSRGEWVFVSDRPLVPGQHEIGLLSRSGPQSRLSDQVVVLIAPEPRQDIAGQPTGGDADREKPLALLVPRDEIGATTVLQSPPAVVTERAPDDPASRPGRLAIGPTTTTPSSGDARPSSPADRTADGGAPVSIDVVDYDEAGQLIVSGRSAPQSDVRLYLDNEYVGTARAGADGSFQVQPSEPVRPGVYALRIDEVSPVGSVTARAETPFQRANEVAAIPGYSRVVVQPGNSLWRLARRVYGQGIQYTVIYQANTGQIRNPDLIYPGQIFNVPEMPKDVPAGDPS